MFLFDIAGLRKECGILEEKTYENDFWNDVEAAQATMTRMKSMKHKLAEYDALASEIEELETLLELLGEEDGFEFYSEFSSGLKHTMKRLETFKLTTLLNGEYDDNHAILSIHAGAGGLEAQDWAEMLLRMYRRWADDHEFRVETLDLISDTEGGIKSVTFRVEGDNAYGYLKGEKGVHRLVRISPFDAAKKRHTSFASVDVFPELEDDEEITISPSDLDIATYRSTGAGGQHVNKTSSAVRMTHIPSGIVVECQDERSQLENRAKAVRVLKARLLAQAEEEANAEVTEARRSQVGTGDRSERVRTYNYPQGRVTDHRINLTLYKLENIMNGDIDEFIQALAEARRAELMKEAEESNE